MVKLALLNRQINRVVDQNKELKRAGKTCQIHLFNALKCQTISTGPSIEVARYDAKLASRTFLISDLGTVFRMGQLEKFFSWSIEDLLPQNDNFSVPEQIAFLRSFFKENKPLIDVKMDPKSQQGSYIGYNERRMMNLHGLGNPLKDSILKQIHQPKDEFIGYDNVL